MKYGIAIIGHKGSGKSTAKDIIMDLPMIDESEYAVYVYPMADTLKRMASVLVEELVGGDYIEYIYGSWKEKNIPEIEVSARKILQTLGTEWGRDMIHPDIWTIIQKKRIQRIDRDAIIIVDDVRFQNELDAIYDVCDVTVLLEIEREGCSGDDHISERKDVFPRVGMKYFSIDNSFSKDLFREKLEYVMKQVLDHAS